MNVQNRVYAFCIFLFLLVTSERITKAEYNITFRSIRYINHTTNTIESIQYPSVINGKKTAIVRAIDTEPSVYIEFIDHRIYDMDSISILLNDQFLIQDEEISKTSRIKFLGLERGKAYVLTLYAINEGNIVPNTCTVAIKNSDGKTLATMKTEILKNTAIIINCNYQSAKDTLDVKEDALDDRIILPSEDTLSVCNCSIELSVWDYAIYDHDTICLFLNGVSVLTNYGLNKQKEKVQLTLNRGENVIVLWAVNLGFIPPNTAAFIINDSCYKLRFWLSSDNQTCSSIKVYCRGNAKPVRKNKPKGLSKKISKTYRSVRYKIS